MVKYYGTAIIPARPESPKDKPNKEAGLLLLRKKSNLSSYKLHDMRLPCMADAFESQCNDSGFTSLSFEDHLILVDKKQDKRCSTNLLKLIHYADFRYPNACMENIGYHPTRKLDKAQMLQLSTCICITDNHHVILKGASGNGKTYIACALGIDVCRNFMNVRYIKTS